MVDVSIYHMLDLYCLPHMRRLCLFPLFKPHERHPYNRNYNAELFCQINPSSDKLPGYLAQEHFSLQRSYKTEHELKLLVPVVFLKICKQSACTDYRTFLPLQLVSNSPTHSMSLVELTCEVQLVMVLKHLE